MAADKLKYASGNSASTTLAVAMSNSDTTATLTSDTNFSAKAGAGMVIIDEGTATEEFAYATGKTGSALTTPLANRGLEGGSAQAHQLNASVKGIITAGMWNDLIDSLVNVLDINLGTVDTTKVVTPTGTQTLTNKRLTSPKINEDVALTATATELNLLDGVTTIPSGDGWVSSSDTWTYASATTFTIAGADRTSLFTKGTRLKLTQTTAKYFVVVSSSFSTDTTVTVTGGSDYTLANAAITSPSYSYAANPQGFPGWFNYAPTYTGFSANPSGGVVRFAVVGTTVFFNHGTPTAGTSNSGTFTISLPIAASPVTNYHAHGSCQAMDNGSYGANSGLLEVSGASDTTLTVARDQSGTGFTGSGNKNARFMFMYEI